MKKVKKKHKIKEIKLSYQDMIGSDSMIFEKIVDKINEFIRIYNDLKK